MKPSVAYELGVAKGVLWSLLRAGRTAAWHSGNSKTNKNAFRVSD